MSSKGAGMNPLAASMKASIVTNGAMTLTSTGLRSKDKKIVSDAHRKERERRRRKLIVDQMRTY